MIYSVGFYSGIGPAIIGVTPYVGLNFAFYETLKTVAQKFHDSDNATVTVVKKGILGGIAGGSSKFMMYPLDTVKKRLQAQTLQSTISDLFEGPRYNGMKDCFAKIYHDEGIKGFYRVMFFFLNYFIHIILNDGSFCFVF